MARIPMMNTFALIPEGWHTFRVEAARYDEQSGRIEVRLRTANGLTHTERFSLRGVDGSPNSGALNAFSYFVKTVMNDFALPDIDPEELVGHCLRAEVVHDVRPSNRWPGRTVTFIHLARKEPASDFKAGIDDSSYIVNGLGIEAISGTGVATTEAARGANQAARDANQATSGANQAAKGANQANKGANQADKGADQAAKGANQATSGANQAARGESRSEVWNDWPGGLDLDALLES